MQSIITNPFYLYSIIWSFTLVLYKIHYIKVFPRLSTSLLIFFCITIIFSTLLGYKLNKSIKKFYVVEKKEDSILFYFILLGWILTFIYEGKIPLFEILRKTGYRYVDFKGIPTMSALIWTLTGYHNLRSFSQFVIFKKYKYLIYVIIEIICYLLIYRRGPILILILLNFMAYMNLKKINYLVIKCVIGMGLLLYVFGILGNIRHGFSYFDTSMLKYLLNLKTPDSIVDPFLWSYIYITSPLSNLQYILDCNDIHYNILEFIRSNMFFDFIAKRIMVFKESNTNLLIEQFNVQTGYSEALKNLGITGMYIIYIYYNILSYIYIKFMKNTSYLLEVICLISVANILFIFDNMYTNSALGITLLYPLFFYINSEYIRRKK